MFLLHLQQYPGLHAQSVQEGKVSMETLNTACRRILEAKYKLGLFDNPYKYCDPKRPARGIYPLSRTFTFGVNVSF